MSEIRKCEFCEFTVDNYYDYREHVAKHYKDPNLKMNCGLCHQTKSLTEFRLFKHQCRLCVYIFRYRYGKTKQRYEEYLKDINANLQSVSQKV